MNRRISTAGLVLLAVSLCALPLAAQQSTGSVSGTVTSTSGEALPGVTVEATSDVLPRSRVAITGTAGDYRLPGLPPGNYTLTFTLEGMPTQTREVLVLLQQDARIDVLLDAETVTETLSVVSTAPMIDVSSPELKAAIDSEVIDLLPVGQQYRDLIKLIPGVQVATYDVGGTQSIQQSSLSSHGSNTNDVSYNIDGATVNWPGGGGGATMIYYDQGMFEEVNYMTSAIPAEMLAGGVSINMVTKDGGNIWRGNLRYNFSNDSLQSENWHDAQAVVPTFRGNPTRTYYGRGPIPQAPKVLWSYPSDGGLCGKSTDGGGTSTWCGTGWTGQPSVWDCKDGKTWVAFGAYDYGVHWLDSQNGPVPNHPR